MERNQSHRPDGSPPVLIVGSSEDPTAGPRSWGAEEARRLLRRALAPDLLDDRFDGPWPPVGLVAAAEVDGTGRPSGYLGGTVDRGRLQLDGLLVESRTGDRANGGPLEGRGSDADELGARADRLWRALEPRMAAAGARSVELWGHPARPWHEALAARHGLAEARALHQLRCALPIDVDVIPAATRPFDPGRDTEALIRVNNRAFATHPDQGGMTGEDIAEATAQPWFDPEGIRLLDDPDRPGALVGFCWTKIHEPAADGQPRLGEIYAIGVDPDHHGRGLGAPLTAAGLRWLADQGLTTGMLYVEADNRPALRTYERLGFHHHRTDRAWRKDLSR